MPHPIDIHVGTQVRTLRQRREISLVDLSIVLEVPREQIENYEHGIERISSSHLWELAGIFGVPVEVFFEGIEDSDDSSDDEADDFEASEDMSDSLAQAGGAPAAITIEMLASSEIELDLFDLVRPSPLGRGRH